MSLTDALVAIPACTVYAAGWLVTARKLFALWRPSRAPLCGKTLKAHQHDLLCYRRRKPDLTTAVIDSDAAAAGGALAAGAFWWAVIIAAFVRHNPPEIPAERKMRLEKERKRTADMEADNERLRREQEAT
jgi:hypothetical protein